MPVLAFCGWSGSGKTTLIEQLVGRLIDRGLRVAVVKHDAHGFVVDREGKDSDRFFRAGADIWLHGPGEAFVRFRPGFDVLHRALRVLGEDHDVILVEGHKNTPLPKVWVCAERENEPPSDLSRVLGVLQRDDDRLSAAWTLLEEFIDRAWRSVPVRAGILIGGRSARMGTPKHLLTWRGRTWVETVLATIRSMNMEPVLLGAGEIPSSMTGITRLPDPPGLHGPLAGWLAAFRWAPESAWMFLAADMPAIEQGSLGWLVENRLPGRWGVFGSLDGDRPEPMPALAEPQARGVLESHAGEDTAGPRVLAVHERAEVLPVPDALRPQWNNLNTPEDRDRFARETNK